MILWLRGHKRSACARKPFSNNWMVGVRPACIPETYLRARMASHSVTTCSLGEAAALEAKRRRNSTVTVESARDKLFKVALCVGIMILLIDNEQ